jgi:DNA (cytosine-5)-methyltransferase 1
MLTVGSLFTGIGGIDLGLERTGHFRTIWMSEIDKYANQVLAKHWPNVPNLGNIKEIDFGTVERPDVLVGGYPCQPFSYAGKRRGETDPRHLWPECLRALRVLRPRYALFENVRGHLSMGFARVLGDLASIGFDAEWQIIPAASVGAPHRRDRLFIVAYPNNWGCASGTKETESELDRCGQDVAERGRSDTNNPRLQEQSADMADADSKPGHDRGHSNSQGTIREWSTVQKPISRSGGYVAHAESSTRRSAEPHNLREVFRQTSEPREQTSDSRPDNNWWEVEPDVGRVANGVPARVDRLKGLGNAVVPQVAELIGYMIAEHAIA